ncbi:hypothetical protein J4409_02730 [Candidatus Woesearchaeota archaeon]|nr:hypothetical protein [Candidatus Woesearchaeota archaeon]
MKRKYKGFIAAGIGLATAYFGYNLYTTNLAVLYNNIEKKEGIQNSLHVNKKEIRDYNLDEIVSSYPESNLELFSIKKYFNDFIDKLSKNQGDLSILEEKSMILLDQLEKLVESGLLPLTPEEYLDYVEPRLKSFFLDCISSAKNKYLYEGDTKALSNLSVWSSTITNFLFDHKDDLQNVITIDDAKEMYEHIKLKNETTVDEIQSVKSFIKLASLLDPDDKLNNLKAELDKILDKEVEKTLSGDRLKLMLHKLKNEVPCGRWDNYAYCHWDPKDYGLRSTILDKNLAYDFMRYEKESDEVGAIEIFENNKCEILSNQEYNKIFLDEVFTFAKEHGKWKFIRAVKKSFNEYAATPICSSLDAFSMKRLQNILESLDN